MDWVRLWTTLSSILTRTCAVLLLQVIPGAHASKCYWFFLAYLAGNFILASRRNTSRVSHNNLDSGRLHINTNEASASSLPIAGSASSPSRKKNRHSKKPSYAQVVEGAHPDTPSSVDVDRQHESTSYADVAKGVHPHSQFSDGSVDPSSSATRVHDIDHRTCTLPHESHQASRSPRPGLWHIITGAPTSSRSFNLFSLLLNTALILMCLDFQLTPLLLLKAHETTFIRVGAVSHTSVKLIARLPPSLYARQNTSALLELENIRRKSRFMLDTHVNVEGMKVVYRPSRSTSPWQYGGLLSPSNETDYVGVLEITGLTPSTEYQLALAAPPLSNRSVLDALVPRAIGTPIDDVDIHGVHRLHPSIYNPQYFRTAPDPRLAAGGSHYTFAATSCIKPGWPYIPGGDHFGIKGAVELADRISPDNVDFLMFMGDFVYADSPPRAITHEQYFQRYRQVYSSRDYRRIYERIPTLHIYDDHELVNDYAGQGNDTDPAFTLAHPSYDTYLGAGNPSPSLPNRNYYSFQYGDSAFFVWDARRYRSKNEAVDNADKTMLGSQQKAEFLEWLSAVNQTITWKFIVSSVPFMTLWGGPNGQYDTWGGFQTERSELMDVMQYVPNIIVLSGDRHEFAAAVIRDSVIDLSISPLNQFTLPLRTLSPTTGLGATGEDRLLKYLPDGKRKFGIVEVDSRTLNQPKVSFKLYINGKDAYNLDIHGQVVHKVRTSLTTTIGARLSQSLAELLGLGRRNWFPM